jgi:hypothetical protein
VTDAIVARDASSTVEYSQVCIKSQLHVVIPALKIAAPDGVVNQIDWATETGLVGKPGVGVSR